MAEIKCKSCGSSEYIKSGFVRNNQRYKCRQCSCHFTLTSPRGKPAEMKALAVLLYSMGNAMYGMIGKLLGVSKVSVYKWIKAAAASISEPSPKSSSSIVQLDEVWHFVDGKNKIWVWRAYDPVSGRTLAWELGGRDDATCKKLIDKVGLEGNEFVTDDWEGFHRLIPAKQLFTGKDFTFAIE